jgi:mono/diheme cytochrome c family protein
LLSILVFLSTFTTWAEAQEHAKSENTVPAVTATAAGQETFRSYCTSCHGKNGKGNGPDAASLKKQPPDLTLLAKKNGGKFPAATVSSVIRGTDFITDHTAQGMPVWGDAFRAVNHDEIMVGLKIQNLTLFIESIQQR